MTDTTLTPARQHFIDKHFYEGAAYTRAHFEQLGSSAELHYLLCTHNWDDDNRVLQWLADSPLCSRATALEMFWLAQPQDFQHHKPGKKLRNKADAEIFCPDPNPAHPLSARLLRRERTAFRP